MRYVFPGNQSTERLNLLLRFTGITSISIKKALHMHLVTGYALETSAVMCKVPKGNLSRAVDVINKVCEDLEELKVIDGCKKLL